MRSTLIAIFFRSTYIEEIKKMLVVVYGTLQDQDVSLVDWGEMALRMLQKGNV
ncbi:hypothetical protein PPOP_1686 [Paenibacillus popilliae ATCC 14706]|uniref:Uncharacterized protein n=1 Tax=Paenibacillus popilliae ATCC 14706 TaxID=1212764 RepID=M9M0K3_PAEPP|nr:hypothetical protein PPOP_1686 [Paenibacillus popilliae ATCC 14706]